MRRLIGLSMLCLTLRLFAGESAEPVITPTETSTAAASVQALNRGLHWLARNQAEDGSWSNARFPALTALGLWAFSESDYPERRAICAKAAAFIEGCIQEDGGIYLPATGGRGSGGLSTYNTAICMIALQHYDSARFARTLIKARTFMAKSQLQGDSPATGGFGYDQTPPPARPPMADLSNSGWAMQSMRATESLKDLIEPGETWADLDWPSALAFVEKLQISDSADPENDGGFTYNTGGDRSPIKTKGRDEPVKLCGFGSMTYAGIESMIYAHLTPDDPRVRSALTWAARHWSVTENPGMGSKGLFYYYTIMSKALDAAGCNSLTSPSGNTIDWRRELSDQLVTGQQADGSWKNDDNTFWESDSALVTAYGILTLQNCRLTD